MASWAPRRPRRLDECALVSHVLHWRDYPAPAGPQHPRIRLTTYPVIQVVIDIIASLATCRHVDIVNHDASLCR